MSVYDLVSGNEDHPVYKELEAANRDRQYSFLESVVESSLQLSRPYLTQAIVRGLNYHAIAHLHATAGEFRKRSVNVGDFTPGPHYNVEPLMGRFISTLQSAWNSGAYVTLGCVHSMGNQPHSSV